MTGSRLSSDGLDARRKRLLFRCWHRGTRELDLIVGRFADTYLPTLSDAELSQLEVILDVADPELYDALIGSLDHLKKGHKDKKVLLIISDGLDNASRRSLEDAVREAQRSDAVIYAIGIFSDDDLRQNRSLMRKARSALTELTTATGGLAFFPDSADETEALCTQIAHDIRNQYTLG